MALHSSRYVRDTLEHNPDTMFQLRLDEVQVFNRMGVESKRRLSFPSRLADIRESAWQQEQARMRQGRDRDDGWRRIQVCVEESGSDDEEERRNGNGRGGNEKCNGDRFPSSRILERRRSSYKSQQKEHGRTDSVFSHLGQRMAGSGSSAYCEHGMTKPPALFSYHNVQKKSCLVEELEESETEEEEREVFEEEKEELFESEEEESEAYEEEEEKEVRCWGGIGRKTSPSSSVKGLQAEARRRFSVGDPCFQFPSQPYVEPPTTLYIQPEDRLNYILEEEETEDEEEENEEERITFTIEEDDEEECEKFPLSEFDEDTPSYTVSEEEEQEERVIPILIEEEENQRVENSWRLDQNKEQSHESLTREERAAAIGEIVRSQQREVGARLRRNTREESVSAIGDLIKDLSAELEQLKQNRRVLESLRRQSSTEKPPNVMSKPPKGQNSTGSRLTTSERRRKAPLRKAEFTTYADLLSETMCTPASAPRQSPSRRHSSVVLPTSSSPLMRGVESKPLQPKRFSTAGGSLLSSSVCRVVREEEEPACETYSCDQLVTKVIKSLSCNSLNSCNSISSHSPPSSSPSLSPSESLTDLGSEQSQTESELMSDPSSCDELWLLPQQVLAIDIDLLQAELPLSRSSTEDLRPEDLRFARASPSKSTFWMYSVVQGRLRSC